MSCRDYFECCAKRSVCCSRNLTDLIPIPCLYSFSFYSSGTLQDGFELRSRLNYYEYKDPDLSDLVTRSVHAKFIGRALVRGYKAYLE